jgi:hypothetical protein
MGSIRTRRIKAVGGALALAGFAAATALPASADTAQQIVVAQLLGTVSISTAPTATVDFGSLAPVGPNTTSGGSIGVTSNVPYTLMVQSNKAKMTKYVAGVYTDAVTLTAALAVVPVLSSGTGVPVPSLAIGTTAAPIGAGILPGTDVYALTLSQTTSLTDTQTSYREVLTYTASAVL